MKAAQCERSAHLDLPKRGGKSTGLCKCARAQIQVQVQVPQIEDPRAVNLSDQRLTLSLITTAAMQRYHWWLHWDGWSPRSTWAPGRFRMGETGGLDWRMHRAEVSLWYEPVLLLEMGRNGPRHWT